MVPSCTIRRIQVLTPGPCRTDKYAIEKHPWSRTHVFTKLVQVVAYIAVLWDLTTQGQCFFSLLILQCKRKISASYSVNAYISQELFHLMNFTST